MESGNEVSEWFSRWWGRKVLFLGRPDDFRAPGWAPRDQTCARSEAQRRNGFALRARDGVDRFQCFLRSGPAAAKVARRSEPAPDHPAIFAPKPGTLVAHRPGSRAGRKD